MIGEQMLLLRPPDYIHKNILLYKYFSASRILILFSEDFSGDKLLCLVITNSYLLICD